MRAIAVERQTPRALQLMQSIFVLFLMTSLMLLLQGRVADDLVLQQKRLRSVSRTKGNTSLWTLKGD